MFKIVLKKIFHFLNILNISLLIAYYFETLQNFVKIMIILFTNESFAIEVYKIYTRFLINFKIIMYGYIILLFLKEISKKIRDMVCRRKKRHKVMESNGLNKDLYDYINSDEKKTFVITGDWGVGKTHTIDRFFEEYFKYEKRDVYRISCFGMENRKDVLEELKNVFEKQDNSTRKYILSICKKIPIIGDLIEDAFKSDYEFKDLKEKSIFVFDDFERINIKNFKNSYVDSLYRVRHVREDLRDQTPMRDIAKEFKEIESSLERFEDSLRKIEENKKLEKFNVVTGIINELIERYNMKVIVICNRSEINNEFFNDIFEEKIESSIYKINTKFNISMELANKNINNKLYLDEKIKKEMQKFFADNAYAIDVIWNMSNVNNIRILSKSISAFIDIVEKCNVENKYYRDLFFTIFITNIYDFFERVNSLSELLIGELVKAFYERKILINPNFNYDNELLYRVSKNKKMQNLRWFGLNIGTAWMLGEHEYYKIEEEFNKYDVYNYDSENDIFNSGENLVLDKNKIYKFEDVIYALKLNIDNSEIQEQIWEILEKGHIVYDTYTNINNWKYIYDNIEDTKEKIILLILLDYGIDEIYFEKIFKAIKKDIDIKEVQKISNIVTSGEIKPIADKCIEIINNN